MDDFLVKGFGVQAVSRQGASFNLPGLLIGLAVAGWIYYDAEKNGMRGWLWALIALAAGVLPGLAVYLIWRYFANPRRAKLNGDNGTAGDRQPDGDGDTSDKEPKE